MRIRPWLPCCLATVVACGETSPRVPPAQPLGEPIAEHPEPFTGPIRLVELRDGRVLAYDARESRLERIDFSGSPGEPISRRGDGPLEYRSGHRLALAPGDSVWMFDIMRGRILVLSPAGAPVRGFAVSGDGGAQSRLSAPRLLAVGTRGEWYGDAQGLVLGPRRAGISDSVAIVRVETSSGRGDTLAMLASHRDARGNGPGAPLRLTMFDPIDAAAVSHDGRVLVVRGSSLGIEVIGADGTRATRPALAHQRLTLSEADVRGAADSMTRATRAMVGAFLGALPAGRAGPPRIEHAPPDPLPSSWPLFSDALVLADPRGRAWLPVRDSSLATAGQRFDLVDFDGRWVTAVRLPPRHELVAFGRDAVYAARRDADDLLWLGRYPLP